MGRKEVEESVKAARAKALRARRHDVERRLQEAVIGIQRIDAVMARYETEKFALEKQVSGLQAQLQELEAQT